VVVSVYAADRAFTSYADVKPVLTAQRGSLPAELKNPNEARWNAWARKQDTAIRARLDQGDLDSMVNLLLYGTSFTDKPRILMENLGDAAKTGLLKARVDALVAGLRDPRANERLAFLRDAISKQGLNPDTQEGSRLTGVFILKNLERVVAEVRTLGARGQTQAKAAEQKSGDPATQLDRRSLFADRGVSLDTSIFPNYSIDQTLVDLKQHGLLREGQVKRVAVVGPGLDFIDKNEASGYDYYPQQTLQPFAFYDSLLRLKLAGKGGLSVSIFDISSRVIDHLKRARERAAKQSGYTIQLPRDNSRSWPAGVVSYWRTLGDQAGTGVAPIQPPTVFAGLETRAVSIQPEVVLALHPSDLNIVLERAPLSEAERFDIIIGTNIFVYYEPFEQALALENAGAMLKTGGLLLSNDKLPEVPGGTMKLAGITQVKLENQGVVSYSAVGWYQKR
jgi:SAM-dependent methyltransferase